MIRQARVTTGVSIAAKSRKCAASFSADELARQEKQRGRYRVRRREQRRDTAILTNEGREVSRERGGFTIKGPESREVGTKPAEPASEENALEPATEH